MGQLNTGFFIKFFEPLDGFIKVRGSLDEIEAILGARFGAEQLDRDGYMSALAAAAIPDLEDIVHTLVRKIGFVTERSDIEGMLYHIITTVHPSLEINQVSLTCQSSPLTNATFSLTGTASRDFRERLLTLEQTLRAHIYGQDEAIRILSDSLLAECTVRLDSGPLCALLFVGPTGVGKTEVAKVMARHLFGPEKSSLLRINCVEYTLPHEVAKLIGSPPGYIAHSDGGILSEGLKQKGQRLVLFDELEKAHARVFDFLLPYTDDGEFMDAKGATIDGRQSAIVMTSNIGSDRLEDARSGGIGFSRGGADAFSANVLNHIRPALRQHFRPEFIARLKIIPFRGFNRADYASVMQIIIDKAEQRLAEAGYTIRFSPDLVANLIPERYEPQYGARELKGHLKTEVFDPLRLWIGRTKRLPDTRSVVRVFVSDNTLCVGEVRSRGRSLANICVLSNRLRPLSDGNTRDSAAPPGV
jgi:ATP-dependent Clp protease ATP-binding subunit ClpA